MRFVRSLAVVALLLAPTVAHAQRGKYRYHSERCCDAMPGRQLSLAVGILSYDLDNIEGATESDQNYPMAALRAEWRLSKHVRSELGFAYALAEMEGVTAEGDPQDVYSSLMAATVGVQAELPMSVLRPYIGIAAGFFGRFDDEEGGERFVRVTHAVPVGLRIPISPRLGLRGELRFRLDQHEGGVTAENVEKTVGLSVAF
jgi:hypothetical protein